MTETQPQVPLSPHELLNQAMRTAPLDPDGEKKLAMATTIYIELLKPLVATTPPDALRQEAIKTCATIAVDAANILLQKLGGR